MKRLMRVMALAVIAGAGVCLAQDAAATAAATPGKFFKMDFVIREVDGAKTVNSRAFSLMVPAGSHKYSQVRTGNKVGKASGGFVDVGVSIDVQDVVETAGGVAFSGTLEMTSIPGEASGQESSGVIRQNRFASSFVVPMNKKTVIVSADNLDSKSMLQVEVTVGEVR